VHTAECRDWRDWWPEAAPEEQDLKGLPAKGAVTNPIRLPGEGAWLGIWGDFSGLYVSYNTREKFPARSGCAIPYPMGHNDLFLSQSGGSGLASMARFKTREAALAWGGAMNQAGAGGAIVGEGTDVTLGVFSPGTGAGNGVQIFLAATAMPVGGATKACKVFVNCDPDNADDCFFGETQALSEVSGNNVVGAAGQDIWNIPAGGKLWVSGAVGGLKVAARVRS
jgi:hypothetical protein